MKFDLKRAFSKKVENKESYSFGSVDYTIPSIPCIIEKKQDPWVHYGENNLYPLQVADLRNGSAIHNSIIKTKVKMTAGYGFLINGSLNEVESEAKVLALPPAVKSDWELFIKNPNNNEDMSQVTEKLADDLQTQGQYAYEVIFNMDFTKIVRIKYVNVETVRSGKMVNGQVKTYYICRDWTKAKQKEFQPTEIAAFDKNNKTDLNQLVFEKVGKGDYYGELPYKGCLTWILVDFKMGLYHLSGIDNGMNPGMHFRFYKLPGTEEEKAEILRQLDKQYRGALKVNKRIVTFSNGKELASEIEPIQTTNLDKQLLLLAELADQKILTGHQLSAPILAGITPKGAFNNSGTEIKVSATLFDNLSTAPDRKHLERSFQKILDYNNTPIKLEINPFDPFKTVNRNPTQPTV